MILSDENMEVIRAAISKVKYGQVTIEVNETNNTFDVVVTERIRVEKANPYRKQPSQPGSLVSRHG